MLAHPARPLPPEQTARWLAAYWQREPLALHAAGVVGRSLRLQGRISDLLALHADLPRPAAAKCRGARATEAARLRATNLARPVVETQGQRSAILRRGRRTRRGLCRPILALPRPGPRTRATALATIVLARRAAGLPYEGELAEARFLDPAADLVAEAMETSQFQGA